MINLGIIYTSYGMPEYIDISLNPWVKAKEKYNIKIAATHGQFKEYHENEIEDNDIKTLLILDQLNLSKSIDCLYIQNDYNLLGHVHTIKYHTEAELRDKPLQWLLKESCDYILLVDGDEEWKDLEIDNLFKYLNDKDNEYYTFFRIEYKNLINDEKHYIKGFNPKRIWKTSLPYFKLHLCVGDNDMTYIGSMDFNKQEIQLDEYFPSQQISDKLISPAHFSWLNNERSKNKINYQLKRWGLCSYVWEDNQVKFNPDYYKNKPCPEIFIDK